jgi:hypothetical protein
MKKIWKSKVFWLAILQGISGTLLVIYTEYPQLGWIAIAKSCVDIWLRVITEKAVTL